MVFDKYLDNSASRTAAGSSNRGIVCGFIGATLLLDITNVHFVPLLGWFLSGRPPLRMLVGCCHKTRVVELHCQHY